MKTWILIFVIIATTILVPGIVTGFWQHLFTPNNPNPTFQIDKDDRMIPAVKGYSEYWPTSTIKQVSVFCMPIQIAPVFPWREWCVW
jgi:hypothetical protein